MRSIYAMLKMYENQFKGASVLGTSGTLAGAGAELQASYFLCRGGSMFPNVDLPQPDSPAMPYASPAWG